jgi:hypothetical protein
MHTRNAIAVRALRAAEHSAAAQIVVAIAVLR